MKYTLLIVLVTGLLLSANAKASLIDRGNGLIYDTDLNITWLQDVSLTSTLGLGANNGRMNFNSAMNFVNELEFAGFTEWRLPTTPIFDSSCNENYISELDHGYNCTGSEFGHLYYEELGNFGAEDENGSAQSGFGMINTGLFTNFPDGVDSYWTSTYYPDSENNMAFFFDIHNGQTGWGGLSNQYHILAVHDGDIGASVVPVPAAAWLFGSGLISLVGFARRKTNA